MDYSIFSHHLPLMHFYVLFVVAIFFVIIGAMATITGNTATLPLSLSQNTNHAASYESSRKKPVRAPLTFSHQGLLIIAQLAILAAIILCFKYAGNSHVSYFKDWIDDTFFSSYLMILILFISSLTLFYSYEKLSQSQRIAEFYILFFFALLGLGLLCYARHMVFIYVGLELASLSLYGLLALERESKPSIEAAMKYFVLGALSSGLLLFGLSMLYGATGSLFVKEYYHLIMTGAANRPLLEIGTIFILASVAFKLGLAPFHSWVPDVYQGASYPAAMVVSSITKLAIFAMLMRLVITTLFPIADQWKWMVLIIAFASLIVGYFGAIVQTSFRRFLGYSSIANLGFMMLALFSAVEIRAGEVLGLNTTNAISADLYYLIVYQFTSVAVFAFAWVIAKDGVEGDHMDQFKGLNKRYPWFALMLALLMFSMAGVPPMIGFWAKLLVLQSLLAAHHVIISAFAVIITLVGAYYYLRVVKLMYFDEPPADAKPIVLSRQFRLVLSINCLLLFGLALIPGKLIALCFLIMT